LFDVQFVCLSVLIIIACDVHHSGIRLFFRVYFVEFTTWVYYTCYF